MDERLALTDTTHNRWAKVALVIRWTVVVGADISAMDTALTPIGHSTTRLLSVGGIVYEALHAFTLIFAVFKTRFTALYAHHVTLHMSQLYGVTSFKTRELKIFKVH